MSKENLTQEQENNFIVGYEDGRQDRIDRGGRSLDKCDPDWGAGYVAGKYSQILCRPVTLMARALEAWKAKL